MNRGDYLLADYLIQKILKYMNVNCIDGLKRTVVEKIDNVW